jgi:hypothetical protein
MVSPRRTMMSRGRNAFQEMREVIRDEISGVNVCVASFSEESDSLSQGRAYAGNAGFAIGFEGGHLASLTATDHAYLAPCIYENDRQKNLVQAVLLEVIEQNLSPERLNPRPGGNLSAYLLRFAPLLKHRSFGAEGNGESLRLLTAAVFLGLISGPVYQ